MNARLQAELAQGFEHFWERFSGPPAVTGKRILEVGCGRGALSIDLALRGATHVTGVDIRTADIEHATEFVAKTYPQLRQVLSFSARPLAELDAEKFDLVVSKDAFEHIIDVGGILTECRRLIADTGHLYIGFSPLYHSPYGDHDRRRTAFRDLGLLGRVLASIPWGHLVLESQIIRRQQRIQNRPVDSMQDLNLNQLTIREFRERIRAAGFVTEYLAVNQGNRLLARLLTLPRMFPWLENLFTYNVYGIFRPQPSHGFPG